MIINDKDAIKRLASPMNLINQLRCATNGNGNKKNNAMSLFGIGRSADKKPEHKISEEVTTSFNPFDTRMELQTNSLPQPLADKALQQSSESSAKLDNILENHESQIKLGLAHDNALALLNNSIEALSTKLNDVRADRLPSVISAASKTVESIRKERNENSKNNKDREVHYHFYTPQQRSISDYEVIEVEAQVQC